MKQLLIEINKLIGESGTLRDEATLEHIVANSKQIAKDIATKHPFVDGNKRTAFVYLELLHCNIPPQEMDTMFRKINLNPTENREEIIIKCRNLVHVHREWLDILKEC